MAELLTEKDYELGVVALKIVDESSGDVVLTLPTTDGTSGQVITTDGSGALTFTNQSSSGATLTGSTNNTITTVTGANAFQGESNLTFDGSTLTVTGAATVSTTLTVDGAAVFNESSADVDFRIESNNNANMLFVDGGNDRVGIGGVPSSHTLEVTGTISGNGVIYAGTMFQLTGGRYWSFRESGNDLQLYSGSNAAVPFMIDGDNSDRIGIGTTSPTQMLDVNGTVELNNLTVAGAQGSDGQVLTSTGSGVAWEAVDSGVTASKAIAFSILYS